MTSFKETLFLFCCLTAYTYSQIQFIPHSISTDADGASSIHAVDLDADGDIDVLSAAFIDDKITWYENDGNQNFTDHTITINTDGATSVFAVDLDGDGDMDVLSSSEFDDKIAWYENDGDENFTSHSITTDAWGAYSVYAINVDGDGDIDVLSASVNGDEIAWYENNGNENFTKHTITTSADGAYCVYAVDVDNDGDIDVLSASFEDDKIAWYENDGNENFTAHTITNSSDVALSVYAIDIDNDGDMDILSASFGDDKIAWYENDGDENFATQIITTSANGAYCVYAVDVDNDGDIDVLSASYENHEIDWYENDGNQNFTEHTITINAIGASDVYAADIDKDSHIDILSASWIDKKIVWYENATIGDTIWVPIDFSTIKAAIDVANDGDIVLVSDGTYYENINFNGKKITVASHFLIDGDQSHIQKTIIDGSQPINIDSASVVTFDSGEDTTSILCGFTITNGSGTYSQEWDDRNGGGIYLDSSGAKICHNIIEDNWISYIYSWGGGILAYSYGNHNLIVMNNIIRNNIAYSTGGGGSNGGGIAFWNDGTVKLKNNKIVNNVIVGDISLGGGVSCNGPINQVIVTNNQIVGNTAQANNYLMGGGGIDIHNCVTNTPIVSNNLIADNYTNQNGGGVRIKYAIDYSFDKIRNKYSTRSIGERIFETQVLINNTIVNNTADREGGGLHCVESTQILNSIVWGNEAPTGQQYSQSLTANFCNIENGIPGGVGNIDEDPLLTDTLYYSLTHLQSPCIDSGNPDLVYNDIEDISNLGYALFPAYGLLRNDMGYCGGPNSNWYSWKWPFNLTLPSQPILISPEINASVDSNSVVFVWETSHPLVSKFWFELDTVSNFNSALILGELTDTSLILSGLSVNDEYWWRVRAFNAVGWSDFSEVRKFTTNILSLNESEIPSNYSLDQNYPNPFNPSTKISWQSPVGSWQTLKIYDVLGNEVATLIDEYKPAGSYVVEWNASGLPSGIYFYKLKTEGFVETRKMILMK